MSDPALDGRANLLSRSASRNKSVKLLVNCGLVCQRTEASLEQAFVPAAERLSVLRSLLVGLTCYTQ